MPRPPCVANMVKSPRLCFDRPGGNAQAFAAAGKRVNGVGVYHIYGDETTFGEATHAAGLPKQ